MKPLKAFIGALVIVLVVGVLAVQILPRPVLAQGQNVTPLTTVGCDMQETNFGDLAADAIRTAAGAQIAFVGAISFRAGTLTPGPLTLERVSSLLSNPEEVWAVSQLTGAQIRAALEHSVRTAPLPNNAFMQVSGLTFNYSQAAPQHQRVREVRVGTAMLSEEASYTVAMPLSLAKGGSGYFRIFTKDAILRQGDTGLAAVVVEYARQQGTIAYPGIGRIIVVP